MVMAQQLPSHCRTMGKPLGCFVSTTWLTSGTDAAINTTDIFDTSPYHYVPTESICILFVVLFSISTGRFFSSAQSLVLTSRYRRSGACRTSRLVPSLVPLPDGHFLRLNGDRRLEWSAMVKYKPIRVEPVHYPVR